MVLFTLPSAAHPVAQGAIEILVRPESIQLAATVSMEEVLVAGSSHGCGETPPAAMVRAHAGYFLAHFHVLADGKELVGRAIAIPDQIAGWPKYEFEYPLLGSTCKAIELRQDLLREIQFAPGNQWEASFLLNCRREGGGTTEGLLLRTVEPLTISMESGTAAGSPGESHLDRVRMARAFIHHGIMHILTGYDHLLFVSALLLAVRSFWDLLKVISAFTVAHTITLALAALNIFRLPSSIVEPMIAGSIVFVAVQNIVWPSRSRGRYRLLIAFLFGLFHGLGFAGGLLDAMAGLHLTAATLAIAAFSLGVEIGHQIVVLPAYVLLRLASRANGSVPRHDSIVQLYGSGAISLFGMIYLVAALR